MSSKKLTSIVFAIIACFVFTLTSVDAECHYKRRPNGNLIVENKFIRLVLNPRMGGKAISLMSKTSDTEFCGKWGALVDRLIVNKRRGDNFENKPFDFKIVGNSKKELKITFFAKGRSNGYQKLLFEKTITLCENRAAIDVEISFKNDGETSIPISYWVFNDIKNMNDRSKYYIPTLDGIYEATERNNRGDGRGVVGQDRFIYNPVRGWSAVSNPDGTGLAAVVENRMLSCFYNFFSDSICSIEWLYNIITLKSGEKWTTKYSLLPFSGLSTISGVTEDMVVAINIPALISKGAEFKGEVSVASAKASKLEAMIQATALSSGQTTDFKKMLALSKSGKTLKVPFQGKLPKKGTWKFEVLLKSDLKNNDLSVVIPLIVDSPSGDFRIEPDGEKKIGKTVDMFRKKKQPLALDIPFSYEPDDEIRSKCVKWGKPYRFGRTNALFLIPSANAMEITDLAQRLSLNYNAIASPSGIAVALNRNPDVLAIGGFAWDKLPKQSRIQILDKVKKGMGLLFVAGRRIHPNKKLLSILKKSKGVSYDFGNIFTKTLNVFKGKNDVIISKINKGRIVYLNLDSFVRTNVGVLSPLYLAATGKPKRLSMDVEFEYCYSLLAKSLLLAAGKESPFTMRVRKEIGANGKVSALSVSMANSTRNTYPWSLNLRIRDQRGRLVEERSRNIYLIPGGKTTSFHIPRLPGGVYYADIICRDNWGQSVNWFSTTFQIISPQKIIEVSTDKPSYKYSETMRCEIKIEQCEDRDFVGSVDVYLADLNDDVFASKRKDVKLSQGAHKIVFEFPLSNIIKRSNLIHVVLKSSNANAIDKTAKSIIIELKHKPSLLNVVYHCDSQLAPRILCDGVMDYYTIATQLGLIYVPWYPTWVLKLGFGNGGGKLEKNFFDFADPAIRKKVGANIKKYAERIDSKYRPPCGILVDEFRSSEANLAKYSKNFAEHKKGFRRFLKEQYGNIAGLNAQWGTQYMKFDEILPWTEKELNRRIQEYWKTEKLNFSPYFDHEAYWETLMADYVGFLNSSMRSVYPGANLGFSGMSGILGHNPCVDYWKLIGTGNCPFMGMYSGYVRDIVSSLKPEGFKLIYWGGYDRTVSGEKKLRLEPWENLFDDGDGIFYYTPTTYSPLFAPDRRAYPSAEWIREENQIIIGNGIDALVKSSRKSGDGVFIHYSPASIKAAKLTNRIGETSGLKLFNAEHASLNAILKDIGIQFKYVAYAQIENNFLDPKIHKMIFLPYSQAMSNKEVAQIKNFAKKGGIVVASLKPAVFDDHGSMRENGGALDDLFGVRQSKPTSYKGVIVTSNNPIIGKFKANVIEGAPGIELTTGKALGDFPNASKSALIINSFGKGKGILLNFSTSNYQRSTAGGVGGEINIVEKVGRKEADAIRSLYKYILKMGNVTPQVSIKRKGNDQEIPIERVHFYLGKSEFLGILPPSERKNILPADEFTAVVELKSKKHVYDMRRSQYKGFLDHFELSITNGIAEFLALTTKSIESILILPDILKEVNGGEIVRVKVQVKGATDGVFLATVRKADGTNYIKRTILYREGMAELSFPIPVNAEKGVWSLTIRDPASNITTSIPVIICGE